MRKNPSPESGGFSPRIFLAFLLCAIGIWLAMIGFAAPTPAQPSAAPRISKGETVVPSEFRGDLRKLPQTISPEERKLFIRPLELDIPLPATK